MLMHYMNQQFTQGIEGWFVSASWCLGASDGRFEDWWLNHLQLVYSFVWWLVVAVSWSISWGMGQNFYICLFVWSELSHSMWLGSKAECQRGRTRQKLPLCDLALKVTELTWMPLRSIGQDHHRPCRNSKTGNTNPKYQCRNANHNERKAGWYVWLCIYGHA